MKKNITFKKLCASGPKPRVNKELDKLSSKVLFPEKLALANKILSKAGFVNQE